MGGARRCRQVCGWEGLGGASSDGCGREGLGGASRDGCGREGLGGASSDGCGREGLGGASGDGCGREGLGGASGDGCGREGLGGASRDGCGWEGLGGASSDGCHGRGKKVSAAAAMADCAAAGCSTVILGTSRRGCYVRDDVPAARLLTHKGESQAPPPLLPIAGALLLAGAAGLRNQHVDEQSCRLANYVPFILYIPRQPITPVPPTSPSPPSPPSHACERRGHRSVRKLTPFTLHHPPPDLQKDQGIDLSKDKLAVQRLREASEKAKCELSSTASTDINLPFITADASGPKHLTMTITRAKLETLVKDLLERTKEPCLKCMKVWEHVWGGGVSTRKQPACAHHKVVSRVPGGEGACGE
eukprot:351544-Chlamydomonas_euryale.AAC.5